MRFITFFILSVFIFLIIAPDRLEPSSYKSTDSAWVSIKNQKIDLTRPLSLTELIDIALRNNPNTRKAWKNTLVAKTLKQQSLSAYYPQANVSAEVTREKKIDTNPQANLDDLHYGPAFKITYLLLDCGGRKGTVEETSQRIISADFQYNQAIQDALLGVEKSYYALYSARSGLEAAESDLENAKADFVLTHERYYVGLVSKPDLLAAKSSYDNAIYALENAKGALKDAKANLAQVIGLAADADLNISSPSKDMPADITEEDISRVIEEAIAKRPDIASVRAELKAKKAEIKIAQSNLFPTLNLGGSAGMNQYRHYGDIRYKEHDREYAGYASVNWDIFDGFYNLNKKRQAQKEADAQYETLIQAEIAASVDVWTKYYSYNTALKKFQSSEALFESVNSSYNLALESFKVGLKSKQDLLGAQSGLSDARSKLIDSRKDVFISLAELAHATGSLDAKIEQAKTSMEYKGDNKND
ncbi:MAG: TolC family protein [Candidatus Omnitrophota bacterium]